jgi:hypothetical protein
LTLAFVLLFGTVSAFASNPYETYTYSIDGTTLKSPDAYDVHRTVTTSEMGLLDEKYGALDLGESTDLITDDAGNVYIADRGNNRIVVLNQNYEVIKVIDSFTDKDSGLVERLKEPQGLFITDPKITSNGESYVYVCDTGNKRIVVFEQEDGKYVKTFEEPQADVFPANSVYRPVALAVDSAGTMFVISSSTYMGVIALNADGSFQCFVGAQKVTISAWEKLWRNFQSEEQKLTSETKNAKSFNNIALFGDFIYVTTSQLDEASAESAITSKSKSGDFAPVKMLNAAGTEIMRRNGFYPPSGEVDFSSAIGVSSTATVVSGPSRVVDVAVGPENTWSIIDNKRSKVFTYDFDGNLLFAFGDSGTLLGNIPKDALNAVVYQGDTMLLLDRQNGSFTSYNRTEYGDVLIAALKNQNSRRYDAAIEDWTEVLKRNSNFDAAYIGIGNALYRNHDYTGAVEQYQYAYDTENYSKAYSELRQQWVSDYLWVIPIAVAVLCFAIYWFVRVTTKINKKTAVTAGKRTYLQELLFGFHLILHPFDGFWDLKHEKRGSVRAGTTYLVITIATIYYQSIGAGYVTNPQGNYISISGAIMNVCVPLALWIIGNWCITTLFDGEGSIKDVYIASTYSLLPLILTTIPATIASNFVLASEVKMITLVTTIGFVWLGLLLFFGMMVTHDYTIGKNVITTLATLVGMICIMFIVILFSTLLGKLVGFVSNIVTEIQYRL